MAITSRPIFSIWYYIWVSGFNLQSYLYLLIYFDFHYTCFNDVIPWRKLLNLRVELLNRFRDIASGYLTSIGKGYRLFYWVFEGQNSLLLFHFFRMLIRLGEWRLMVLDISLDRPGLRALKQAPLFDWWHLYFLNPSSSNLRSAGIIQFKEVVPTPRWN